MFTEMVFVFGDVHCDPHAANMMVKPGEDNKPILVLLDHGLYRCRYLFFCSCAALHCHSMPLVAMSASF